MRATVGEHRNMATICSHSLISKGNWFQDLPWIPKSADAKVPELVLHICEYGTCLVLEKVCYKGTRAVETCVVQGQLYC